MDEYISREALLKIFDKLEPREEDLEMQHMWKTLRMAVKMAPAATAWTWSKPARTIYVGGPETCPSCGAEMERTGGGGIGKYTFSTYHCTACGHHMDVGDGRTDHEND